MVVGVSPDAEARDYLVALGYLQTPVVVAGDEQWAGLRPDRSKAPRNRAILSCDATLVS